MRSLIESLSKPLTLAAFLFGGFAVCAPAQVFTIQVGAAPTALVHHGDAWRYHKGTNAPQAGWQSIADAALNSTWATGNGGFGYADNTSETALVQTLLPDMKSVAIAGAPTNYSTLYIRRSFDITSPVDASQHLLLTMDWDDGYVAYLDGVELVRADASGAVGVEPGVGALATVSHESSLGNAGGPIVTSDLGAVGGRLGVGPHVLAILGLNAQTNSTDFILLADLTLGSPMTSVVAGPLLAIVSGNSVMLSGTNTFAGSSRVTINGGNAAFDTGTGAWTRQQPLAPGCNRLIVEAVDAAGATLFSTNQIVVSEITVTNLATPQSSSWPRCRRASPVIRQKRCSTALGPQSRWPIAGQPRRHGASKFLPIWRTTTRSTCAALICWAMLPSVLICGGA